MSCVSLVNWDGKEDYRQVLAHVVDLENEENLMKQIIKLSQDGIKMVEGRVLRTNFFECHDLVSICSLVCKNIVSPMGNSFCPWYT